jgi:uncharacterized membrane protein
VTDKARDVSTALSVGNKIAPWRFLLFLAAMIGGYFAYRGAWPAAKWSDAGVIAFDFAAVVFLATLLPLLSDNSAERIRGHAARNDANRGLILVFTSLLTIVAMAAIAGELHGARHGQLLSMAKLVGTLFLIWLFANSIYALHYAHSYYSSSEETGGDRGGIEFPGTEMPGYGDFVYFAFTLGMTFQTSDTDITAPRIRHVALFHSFFSFLFSIGVIAFTINVLGGGGG